LLEEEKLRKSLGEMAYNPQEESYMCFLSEELKEKENEKDTKINSQEIIKEANRRTNSSGAGKDSSGTVKKEAVN
jgi:hypothetical protein